MDIRHKTNNTSKYTEKSSATLTKDIPKNLSCEICKLTSKQEEYL